MRGHCIRLSPPGSSRGKNPRGRKFSAVFRRWNAILRPQSHALLNFACRAFMLDEQNTAANEVIVDFCNTATMHVPGGEIHQMGSGKYRFEGK
jgi:hypothetical protein